VRSEAAASAHRAHPVSSSRDQQPPASNSLRPGVLDYRKSTVVATASWVIQMGRNDSRKQLNGKGLRTRLKVLEK
jgi:hypothetical protein